LRMKQAHRSAAVVPQRFDHPHHGLERTHSLMVIGASGQNQIGMSPPLLNDGDREMLRDDLKAMLRYGDAAAVAAPPTAR